MKLRSSSKTGTGSNKREPFLVDQVNELEKKLASARRTIKHQALVLELTRTDSKNGNAPLFTSWIDFSLGEKKIIQRLSST